MKARPILMSTPMVQALLAGNKTQTRRLFKDKVSADCARFVQVDADRPDLWRQWWHSLPEADNHPCEGHKAWTHMCPYGGIGDVLWVKEALVAGPYESEGRYIADGSPACDAWPWQRKMLPSMFMPKGLNRLTLELTGVRIERLWDCPEVDALAEGITTDLPMFNSSEYEARGMNGNVYREQYQKLWESINGAGSWETNPWVWCLSFNVHRRNVRDYLNERKA